MPLKWSWGKKLADSKDLPEVEPVPGRMSARWGTGTVVIPAPIEVDEILRKIRKGKIATLLVADRARMAPGRLPPGGAAPGSAG